MLYKDIKPQAERRIITIRPLIIATLRRMDGLLDVLGISLSPLRSVSSDSTSEDCRPSYTSFSSLKTLKSGGSLMIKTSRNSGIFQKHLTYREQRKQTARQCSDDFSTIIIQENIEALSSLPTYIVPALSYGCNWRPNSSNIESESVF